MKNNLLLDELKLIQKEYLAILKSLENYDINNIPIALTDSINTFWFEKRNIVKIIGDYYFSEKYTYCLTGLSYLNLSEKKDYGLFLLDNKYIFDDPLPEYLLILNEATDEVFLNNFRSTIVKAIKHNIELIEKAENLLYLLPLRYLSSMYNNEDELDRIAELFTINFFSDIEDKTSYDEKILTKEDAISHLNNSNSSQILLFEGDNPNNEWEDRFKDFFDNQNYFSPSNYNEGKIIYMAIYSHVRQAFAIASMEETFNVTPVVKSFLPLHYYTIVTDALNTSIPAEYKMYHYNWKIPQIAYLFYDIYKRQDLGYSLEDIIEKKSESEFGDKMDRLINENKDFKCLDEIVLKIRDFLDDFDNTKDNN